MIRTSFLAGVVAIALSGCTTPADAQPQAAAKAPNRNCFWANTVSNFNAIDETTVYIRAGVKDVYRLDLFTRCIDIDWNQSIALVSRGGNSICTGFDATIVTKGPIGPQRCEVRNVTKLTPQEVEALPSKQRP